MLYRRSNSPFWWCRFQLDGREIRVSTRTRIRSQAEEFETQARNRAWRQAKLGERPIVYWAEARKRWLFETEKRTKAQDETILEWFDQHLTGHSLHAITREIADKLRALKAQETSKATANRYMALLRALLKRAAEHWSMIDAAPKIQMYKIESGEPRWLTQLEAIKLRHELPQHLRDMAVVSIYTGLRMRNVTGLTWDRVDLKRGHLWIPSSSAKGKKTIGVPLHARALAVIRRQEGNHKKFVFTYDGQPVKDCNTAAFKKATIRAKVDPLRWHDLRHTFASWHAQAGTPLHVIQELGAWKSYEMVQRYAHLATHHLEGYVKNLGQKPAQQIEKKKKRA